MTSSELEWAKCHQLWNTNCQNRDDQASCFELQGG